jgi:hypothetical protein
MSLATRAECVLPREPRVGKLLALVAPLEALLNGRIEPRVVIVAVKEARLESSMVALCSREDTWLKMEEMSTGVAVTSMEPEKLVSDREVRTLVAVTMLELEAESDWECGIVVCVAVTVFLSVTVEVHEVE